MNVGVSEGPSVAVCVGVAEAVGVSDGVFVDVNDGMGDDVAFMVGVNDAIFVEVNEAIGDDVWLGVGVTLTTTVADPVGVLVGVFADIVLVATGVVVEVFVVRIS